MKYLILVSVLFFASSVFAESLQKKTTWQASEKAALKLARNLAKDIRSDDTSAEGFSISIRKRYRNLDSEQASYQAVLIYSSDLHDHGWR
jgi:hypothetical protein